MRREIRFRHGLSDRLILAGAIMMALIASMPARANMIITVGSAVVSQGSTSDFLDLTLTNSGGSPQNIGGFNFEISVTDPDITFTGVNTSTVLTYLFNGDSLFGPAINTFSPGQTMDASDLSASGLGTNVAAGQTLGLGHVLFNVSPTATPGPFIVTLNTSPGATSLADSTFPTPNNVAYSPVNGLITIQSGSVVPEPATLLLALLALPALIIARKRYC